MMQTSAVKYSSLTERLGNDAENAWHVHNLAAERRAAGEPVIMLSIGEEADEQTPEHIINAAVQSLNSGRHHYSDVRGDLSLRQAIANYHSELGNPGVKVDQCIAYTGAQNSLFAVAQCLLEAGDEVILPEPYYTTYPGVFTAGGATAKSVPGQPEANYLPTVAELAAHITPVTRAIVITQPGNPMGACYSAIELQKLVDLCNLNGIWLISDEVYAALVDDELRNSACRSAGAEQCCITIGSLSKSHRMTGWRIGWVIGPQKLVSHLAELSTCMHYGLPAFIMDAATEALDNGASTAASIREAMQQRRLVCWQYLSSLPDIQLLDSGVGMFVVLDLADHRMDASDFALALLEQEGVATLPCTGFGKTGQQLLRIGLCASTEVLEEACTRINRFCEKL